MKGTILAFIAVTTLLCLARADEFYQGGLPSFTAIQSFLPYRGAIVASPDNSYSVLLYAPKEITDIAEAVVSDSGVLNIGLKGGNAIRNETVSVYNYTISVPAASLLSFASDVATSLNVNGTAASPSSFSLSVTGPTGSAKLMVTNLGSKVVNVNTTGFGSAVLGLIPTVEQLNFNSTGTGGASITGMSGTINANINGLSNVQVGPSNDTLRINAYTMGSTQTRITFVSGSCSLISTGAGGSCIQSSSGAVVTSAPVGTTGRKRKSF